VIPKGEYGGGTVMLWDRGWWEPYGDAAAGYAKGDFKFILHGTKLQGRWVLVRMKKRADDRDKADNWLLIKERDEAAVPGPAGEIAALEIRSVATGRDMETIAKDSDRVWSSKSGGPVAASARAPDFDPASLKGAKQAKAIPKLAPQLAKPVEHVPPGEDWLHEIKFDGYRMLAHMRRGTVRMLSRNGLDWTAKFPELVAALARLDVGETVLDGEVVHVSDNGTTSFAALQDALATGRTRTLVYMLFDVLFVDGWDLTGVALEQRKAALHALIARNASPLLRFSDHQIGRGSDVLAAAKRLGLEGIISKRRDGRFVAGRGTGWTKVKCLAEEEFVIVGFTDPTGERSHFGALLLGYYDPAGTIIY
jgi:bifunctional non-homologous end joining protein LigD